MKTNLYILILLIFVYLGGFFALDSIVQAQGKYSYYLSYFYNIGYDTRLPFLKTQTVDENAALKKTIIADRFSLLFASMPNPDLTVAHSNIFFICDVPFKLDDYFSCDSDNVIAPNSNKHLLFHDPYMDKDIYIYEEKYLHKNLVLIPESYLVNDMYKNKLTMYLDARYELDLERLDYVDKRLPSGVSQQYVEKLLELPLEKYAYQLLVMLMFLIILLLLLSELFSKIIRFYSLHKIRGVLLLVLTKMKAFRLLFAILFLATYTLLIYQYSVLHSSADIYEVLVYSLIYLEPVIARGIIPIDYTRVLLVFTSMTTLGLLVITQLFFYFNMVKQNLHVAAKRLQFNVFWGVTTGLSLTGLVFLSLGKSIPNYTAHGVILFFLLLMFLVFTLLSSRARIELKTLNYTSGFRRHFILLFCILVALYGLSTYYQRLKSTVKLMPLFPSESSVLLLPHELELEDDSLFSPLKIKGNIPLFVNDYLIYYPGYKKIRNLDISKFVESANYLIVDPKETDTLVQYALSNKLVRKALLTRNEASNLIYLSVPDTVDRSKILIEVTYDCRISIPPHSLNIKPYYIDKYSGDFLSNLPRVNVLSFPGCDKTLSQRKQNTMLTYRVGVDLSEYNSNDLMFRLNGVIWQKISSIRFVSNDSVLESYFVRNVENETVLMSKLDGGAVLHSYSFQIPAEFNIDDVPSVASNISRTINDLIQLGLVNRNFILQSLTSGAILNLDL